MVRKLKEQTEQLEKLYIRVTRHDSPNGTPNGHRTRSDSCLSDERIIELCRRADNAPKFEALYDRGDAGGYGDDDSRADLALVSILAFYTHDPEQLDRLFRRSALYREKWGQRPDYRRRTIDKALSGLSETYAANGAGPSTNGHAPGLSAAAVVPDAAELLRRLSAYVRRYVVLTDEQADLIALWIIHTHALDAADTTPYLEVISAEKRSGKTRLLEVLSTVTAKPWFTGRVTAAVLVRKVADLEPTLLLDESDAAFKGDKEYSEALRGILNSGFRRGGVASLCVGQGANLAYADFPVFSPKVIAGIGKLPDTISDRAIKIELRRRARSEPVERFRLRKVEPEAETVKAEVAAWTSAHIERLAELEPVLPEELDDRAQEICESLLAVAEVAGGVWPGRARRAVIALAGASAREDAESIGVRLLRDIRGVFDEKGAERLPTGDLLEALCATDEAPWGSLRGEALDARGSARFLKPYKIGPEKLRDGEKTFRGYRRASFEDTWARYAPDPREKAEHPEHAEQSANRADSHVPHNKDVPEHAAYVEHQSPRKTGDVPRVPDVPDNSGGRDGSLCSEVAELMANPPDWLRRQADKHLEDPHEGTLRALCAAVANVVLGNPRRGEEVRPAVEKVLKEWRIVT